MKKKILGIFVCMLLIATALPAVGTMNVGKNKMMEKSTVSIDRSTAPFQINHCLWSGVGDNLHNVAETTSIDLTNAADAVLSLLKQYEIYSPDYCSVEVWDGSSWMTIAVITGIEHNWIPNVYDLSAFAGQIIKIRFVYHTEPDSSSQGIHIDDVVITDGSTPIFEEYFETGASNWILDGWTIVAKHPIAEEFILVRANESPYYIPWTGAGFGSPVLIEDLGPRNRGCGDGRIADFDNDNDLDVVNLQVDRNDGNQFKLVIYENTGSYFIGRDIAVYPASTGVWGDVSKVVTGRFFGNDNLWDLIVLNVRNTVTTIDGQQKFGTSIGSWGTGPLNIILPGNLDKPQDLEAADYDKDGFHDLIISDYPNGGDHNGEAYLFTGNGVGTFLSAGCCITRQNQPLPNMVSGDFIDNNVCSVDIIAGLDDDGDPGQAYLFSNDGTAGFILTQEAFDTNPVDESGNDLPTGNAMDAKDFDKDGELDIVTSWSYPYLNPTNHELFYLQGDGTGTFPDPSVGNMIHDNAVLIAAPEDQIMPSVTLNRPMPGNLYFDNWPVGPFSLPSPLTIILGLLRSEFTITATADDLGCWSLAGVEFFIDNTWRNTVFFGTTGIPPYSWTWTPLPSGFLTSHTIDVIAYDNAGNSNTAGITVRTWA